MSIRVLTINYTSPIATERLTVVYAFEPLSETEEGVAVEARFRVASINEAVLQLGVSMEGYAVGS